MVVKNKPSEYDISNHPDYPQEKLRLDNTITAMKEKLSSFEEIVDKRNEKVRQIKYHPNRGTPTDVLVEMTLAEGEAKQKSDLASTLDKPYFGRVDYTEDGSSITESFYFGRTGFDGPEDVRVINWRAPIASVFYECQGGRASYEAPGGTLTGLVSLKRQYDIEKGSLENIIEDQIINTLAKGLPGEIPKEAFGTDGVISDPVLENRLKQTSDKRLRDIVETIRSEQNRVIREPIDQVLIIQGAAGSGKTTIALHRISYLLYNHKNIKPENVLIIAPNKIFINYISEVLPSLDSDSSEVKQLTFEELVWRVLGTKLGVVQDEKYELLLESRHGDLLSFFKSSLMKATRIKGSLAFKKALENYIDLKTDEFEEKLTDLDFLDGKLVISRNEQVKYLKDKGTPFNQRLEKLKKHIEFRVDNFLNVSDNTEESIRKLPGAKVSTKGYIERVKEYFENQLYFSEGVTPEKKQQLIQQREQALSKISELKSSLLKSYFKGWRRFLVTDTYRDILESGWLEIFLPEVDHEDVVLMEQYSKRVLATGKVEKEDLAALCYLKYLIDGFDNVHKFQHIVIDEAQDLSSFEFYILKLISQNNSFSILGDLAQGIDFTKGTNDWKSIEKEVFGGLPVRVHEILQSYRSTVEIVEFSSQVLPNEFPKPIPVYRRGEEPVVEKAASVQALVSKVIEALEHYQSLGCQSIAVVAKSESQCLKLHRILQNECEFDVSLISSDTLSYNGGISVVPVTLAKGLEFDAAIIWNASDVYFKDNGFDRRLLYVALTRPLHYLHIVHTGSLTPLLNKNK